MATLNIQGKRVKVDDAFLKLTPEQQQATVNDIAAQMGVGGAADASEPMAPDIYASGNAKRLTGRVTPKNQEDPNLLGAATTFLEHGISDLPVVGPLLQGAGDAIWTTAEGAITGQDPAKLREALKARRQRRDTTYPLTALSGGVVGNVAGFGGIGATKAGAQALGLTGKFLPRVANAAASGGAISAADAAVRGNDILEGGIVGAGVNAAFPILGRAGGEVIKAVGRKAAPIVGAMKDAAGEAGRRVGIAYGRDARANPGMLMNGADEATAKAAGIVPLNVDRGGETTRALARSVANQSPEARAMIENTASDRFAGQGTRATDFVTKMAGGNIDDLATQKNLREAAAMVNRPAYEKAMNAPAAQKVFTPELQELLQADAIQSAIGAVMKRGSNRAAVDGFVPLKEVPFRLSPNDGKYRLIQRADGSMAAPSLRFWDQVKRNLDGMIDSAKSVTNPNRELAMDLTQIKEKLVNTLDRVVPQYRQARQGAAFFFGAEDAIEAGRKFARSLRMVPEAKAAFGKFNGAEKKGFQIGYASELIDRIKSVGDRANVINQVFKSPAMREMIELVYGKGKARELEAYVRVEDLIDKLRGAMGNSTTARQLMELGIGAGSGFVLTGGDWKGALGGAALTRGARFVGQKLDDKVMQEVAKLLLSNNPADLKKAIFNATMSEKWMDALDALGMRLEVIARGSTMALAS